jgi:hypothetical protein
MLQGLEAAIGQARKDGPSMAPCIDSSIPLVLCKIHQLVTNSLKHTQPAAEPGSKASTGAGTMRAAHACLAYACVCYLRQLYDAPIL